MNEHEAVGNSVAYLLFALCTLELISVSTDEAVSAYKIENLITKIVWHIDEAR